MTDNVWHKIDMVVENVNSKAVVRLYVDGELDMDSRNQPHHNNTAMNLSGISNELVIGAIENWQGLYMQAGMSGAVDDFKLYNKSLSTDEIRKEYQIDTNTITPTITQTIVDNSPILTAYNRDRYKELSYISPISELERIYNIETGITPPEVFTPSMTEENPNSTPQENLAPTLNTTPTITNTNQILISPETLALLNPNNLGYIPKSETEIELQINGVSYIVNLQNCLQFYTDLETNNINTLAKYLNKLSNLSEEIEYTKYYPSSLYEYDSRGYVTINIPFNGKVVATLKYSTNTNNVATDNLTETSYLVNNYLATPVLILDTNASTTNVIKSDAWGTQVSNQINSNTQTKSEFGLTGHKWDEQSSLTYLHARYMNNTNKTFLSVDPVQYDSFDKTPFLINPQLQNSYSYASQDPVNKIDPDGRQTVSASSKGFIDTKPARDCIGNSGCRNEVGKNIYMMGVITVQTGVSTAPISGNLISGYNAGTGNDFLSGKPLTSNERKIEGGLISLGTVGKLGKYARTLNSIERTDEGLVRVGRVMERAEYDEMLKKGYVTGGRNTQTSVSISGESNKYRNGTRDSSYVEFDIDPRNLLQGGREDWLIAPGESPSAYMIRRIESQGGTYPAPVRNVSNY